VKVFEGKLLNVWMCSGVTGSWIKPTTESQLSTKQLCVNKSRRVILARHVARIGQTESTQ
jgi:hypothetical protein